MAEDDTMPTMGARKANTKNAMAITMLDRPVRAPAAAPEVDSTKVVMELAPMKPPTAAAAESTIRMGWMSSTSPFSSTKSPSLPTATTVPMVSKKSLIRSENTNSSKAGSMKTSTMAITPVLGSAWKGAAKPVKSRPKFHSEGMGVTPRGMPTMTHTMMEMMRAPFTFRAVRMMATNMEMIETMQAGDVKSPAPTRLSGFWMIMPPPLRPMKPIKRPMPMPMARRRSTGMASITALRSPQITKIRMTTPSKKTTAMATRQSTLSPLAPHRVKATMALMPMPEARARGLLATRPMMAVISAAPKHVAVRAALYGTPAAERNCGFTAMM